MHRLGRWLMIVGVLASLVGLPPLALAQTGSFQSQDFGFSLQRGLAWTLIRQGSSLPGVDGEQLDNGVSSVVMGMATSEAPRTVVTTVANVLESPVQFFSVVFDEPGRAAAYFISNDQQIGVFIDAIVFDAQSQLVVLWAFPPAQYEAEFVRFLTLMEGLRF